VRLAEPTNDLKIAERLLNTMISTAQFPTLYEAWQDFLSRIERAWQNAERTLRGEKGFQQWFRPYQELRKKDPLLRFLAHARNAETHAGCATIDRPLRIVIRDKAGHSFSVDRIRRTLEDGTLTIDIETAARDMLLDYEARVLAADPVLVRFKERGVWYNAPRMHLKKPLPSPLHPVDAARAGLHFYRTFVKEAEASFI